MSGPITDFILIGLSTEETIDPKHCLDPSWHNPRRALLQSHKLTSNNSRVMDFVLVGEANVVSKDIEEVKQKFREAKEIASVRTRLVYTWPSTSARYETVIQRRAQDQRRGCMRHAATSHVEALPGGIYDCSYAPADKRVDTPVPKRREFADSIDPAPTKHLRGERTSNDSVMDFL